jgi:hypothetical protein
LKNAKQYGNGKGPAARAQLDDENPILLPSFSAILFLTGILVKQEWRPIIVPIFHVQTMNGIFMRFHNLRA